MLGGKCRKNKRKTQISHTWESEARSPTGNLQPRGPEEWAAGAYPALGRWQSAPSGLQAPHSGGHRSPEGCGGGITSQADTSTAVTVSLLLSQGNTN